MVSNDFDTNKNIHTVFNKYADNVIMLAKLDKTENDLS